MAWTQVISKHLLASFIETKASFKPNRKRVHFNETKRYSFKYSDHDLVNPGTSTDKRDKMFSTHKPFSSRLHKVAPLTFVFDHSSAFLLFETGKHYLGFAIFHSRKDHISHTIHVIIDENNFPVLRFLLIHENHITRKYQDCTYQQSV